jgi:protein arginine kinase activator
MDMLCQECQEQQATVHVTRIINNKKKEFYLCERCAKEKGELNLGQDSFSFSNLLTGLLNSEFGSKATETKMNLGYQSQLECGNCNLTYDEFSRTGKLGCSECYSEFGDRIDKVLKRIHGSKQHTGKVPERTGGVIKIKKEIQQLRAEMQSVVQREEFEKAAELRDKIKELETEIE